MRLLSSSLANEAAKSAELPKRLKLFNWGTNPSTKGDFVINDDTVKMFNTAQEKMGRGVIALDYEHNTVPKSAEYERTKEPRDVAAHLKCEVLSGDGLYCDVLDWTPSGQEKARNYKDLSPAPYVVDGVVLGLHSVALTNTGSLIDLTFLTNDSDSPFHADLVALSATAGIPMKTPKFDVIRQFLGMDGEDDETTLKCMSEAITGKKITRCGPLDKVGGVTPEIKTFMADALKELVAPLTLSVTNLTNAAEAAAKENLRIQREFQVNRASEAGKVIPLTPQQIEGLKIATLTALVDGLPKTVSTSRTKSNLDPKPGDGKIKTDGVQLFALNADGTLKAVSPQSNGNVRGGGFARAASLAQERIMELNNARQ